MTAALEALREERCEHDMLTWPELGKTSCSICKGMPWEPREFLAVDTPVVLPAEDEPPSPALVPVEVGENAECVSCGEPLRAGKPAAWSPILGGLLCPLCERAA